MFTSFRANTPWLYLDVDRVQAKSLGVSMIELFAALQVNLGSLYVNDFNRFGRTWQVNVQASESYRSQVKDLTRIMVRNDRGQMVPLSGLVSVREVAGPVMVARYNMYPAAAVNGNAAAGVSSGQAIARMEKEAKRDLPQAMRSEWTELALLQLQTGSTAMYVFALAVVLVFLVLAAQYESWSLPLAVILVVPMCLLCSIAGVALAHMDVNIFTQVGFVVLIGLACKNAILIVEFAKAQREAGTPRYQATLEACTLRLRPIVMTSLAFILGVVPLVYSRGAGAEMRRTLGTAVFGGMLGVTVFGVFLTPVFYFVIQWFNDLRAPARRDRRSGGILGTGDGTPEQGALIRAATAAITIPEAGLGRGWSWLRCGRVVGVEPSLRSLDRRAEFLPRQALQALVRGKALQTLFQGKPFAQFFRRQALQTLLQGHFLEEPVNGLTSEFFKEVRHGQVLLLILLEQLPQQRTGFGGPDAIMPAAVLDQFIFGAEQEHHRVVFLHRQLIGDDDADAQPQPFHIIHPRVRGGGAVPPLPAQVRPSRCSMSLPVTALAGGRSSFDRRTPLLDM